MTVRRWLPRSALAVLCLTGAIGAGVSGWGQQAGADTDPTTISGQGGSFLQPVVSKLIQNDGPNLSPLFGAYTSTDNDSAIASFVGSAPGTFSADFVISERPLTAAEAATAEANGRSFAYVPIAATPVAIATLAPSEVWGLKGIHIITSADFCQHMPLSLDLLGAIFGFDAANPLQTWSDPRIDCPPGGLGGADGLPKSLWANLDPSASNFALMSLLDSTPSSQAEFAAGLTAVGAHSLTTDTTPSDKWPYGLNTIPGGDQPLIGKLLNVGAQNNAPSQDSTAWQLGATAPISSVWTQAPLGVPWNLATAAVQNAQGAYVPPSTAAAQASLGDASIAKTTDPTTSNLVTFSGNPNDAAAYNSYLMEESYLVVPTSGLTAAKAAGLAQLIRYAVGGQGRQTVSNFGAAPDTPAMTASGLAVASTLDAEAATESATQSLASSPTATTAPKSGTKTATSTSASTTVLPAAPVGTSPSGAVAASGPASSGGLAFTGAPNVGVLLAVAVTFLLVGTLMRRRLRNRRESS